jgi:hypothetical protein
MDGLSVEVKLCRGDCLLVVSSDKFASPFTLAVEQTCASVEHHTSAIQPQFNPSVLPAHAPLQ